MQVSLYRKTENKSCAIFACGCFWGVQHMFVQLQGVERSFAGYTGGKETYPSYESVRKHASSHIEAVAVEYDKDKIDYKALCRFFFEIHDPAQTDGQGPDIGPQYRSAIFYRNQQELMTAKGVIEDLKSRGYKVNTLLQPAGDFWIAEGLHQNYYDNTGGEPYCHIRVKKF
ncbi:MAG: peptide-methionine (S)-S-oxide reductase MsrA [Bacteroidales bacterium]|nr:peptide-methionine (S)-S-oxide reductase MsrA [Bacteroidales bacterium]